MGCRCTDMVKLRNDINTLNSVMEKSSSFDLNINSSYTEQEYLQTDSWSAAESIMVKSDIECKLPNMADKIKDAHDNLIEEINSAIQEMEDIYDKLEEEDNEYHAE